MYFGADAQRLLLGLMRKSERARFGDSNRSTSEAAVSFPKPLFSSAPFKADFLTLKNLPLENPQIITLSLSVLETVLCAAISIRFY